MNNSAGAIEVVVHYPITPNGWRELSQRAAQVSFCHTGDTMEKYVWNVIYHDSNGQKITTFNVFDHCGFKADVKKFCSVTIDVRPEGKEKGERVC